MRLTVNEIRAASLMEEQARRYTADVARLMRDQAEFVHVACPACQAHESTPAFEKYGMTFVHCSQCETLYANPRPSPERMAQYYRESENYIYWNQFIYPASENARREKIARPRVDRVLDVCRRFDLTHNVLLEVGAGFGLFCEEMQKTGFFKRVIAVEPSPDMATTCRKRGIETIEKPIEQLLPSDFIVNPKDISLEAINLDVIAHFEVIEHLFSPRDFLMQCTALLKKDGILILTCPNSKGFDVTVLGVLSSAIDTQHVNLFNVSSLTLLMERCGFEVIETQTPGELDAELVRNKVLEGQFNLDNQPFLKHILIDAWETQGPAFQQFLIEQRLSSHMLLVGRKR